MSYARCTIAMALLLVAATAGSTAPAALAGSLSSDLVVAPSAARSRDGPGRTIVRITDQAPMFASPGGPALSGGGHQLVEHGTAWVVQRSGRWLAIPSVQLHDGALGWIHESAARHLSTTRLLVRVDLSRRQVRVSSGEHRLMRATIAIGAPSSPSPVTRTSIAARIEVTSAFGFASKQVYGPIVIALRRWQPFPSPGRPDGGILAFHGGMASSIGTASSGGCFRMRAADLVRLARIVRVGTPVIISR